MAEERSQAERWVSFAAGIVAPVTVLSALLYYFGYVSSRSQYEYFGIDVDTIGLSTQDYVMRSPQPLLLPLLVLLLVAAAVLTVHNRLRVRLVAGDEKQLELIGCARVAGLVALAGGVLALALYPLLGELPYYALVTPLVISAAAALLAYLWHVARIVRPTHGPSGPQRVLALLLAAVTTTCVFWATATTAQYSGRGLAKAQALNLDRFPVVILDTKERLYLRSPGVEETRLPAANGQTFNYRYRQLRLLAVGQNRMFLVPDRWSASDTTVVVPLDESVRVQFQFQNDPP